MKALEQSIAHYQLRFGLSETLLLWEMRNLAFAYHYGDANLATLTGWRDDRLVANTLEYALFNNWLQVLLHLCAR
ncbi:MAG: hypothetical protein HYV33_00525 [Candidatus Kerfeldbacteria bacterium]|nr:hypothetical protein [Candidatus Kerfeldbacteria bacterium]